MHMSKRPFACRPLSWRADHPDLRIANGRSQVTGPAPDRRISHVGAIPPVTMRDRNNPYGPVRDAATAQVAVLAVDQDSITTADVTTLLIKTLPN